MHARDGALGVLADDVARRQPKYRDAIILLNDSFTLLDDEPVPPSHREFLLRLNIRRMKAALAAEAKEALGGDAPPAAAAGPGPGSAAATAAAGGGAGAAAAAAGRPPMGGGRGPAHGSSPGAVSRQPPRTGGFNPPPAGGHQGAAPGGRALSRSSSSSGKASVQPVTLEFGALGLGS
jgi:hypothetical protein